MADNDETAEDRSAARDHAAHAAESKLDDLEADLAATRMENEHLRTRIESLTKSFRDQMVRDAANDAVIVRQRKEIVALRQGAPSFQIRLREDGAFDVVDPAGFIKDAVPARELAEALMVRIGEQGPG